ncbi:hypothetical protein [Streptomyces sp. NPDC006997]|uniref:Rv1733c family protein n=1 Tax=Streptomyces sp. NPDC006997 TaxID=3155356 RepID=UPI0033E575E3
MAETRRTCVKKVRFWRWRHNPLRRRSDRVEAWVVLATWIAVLVGGVFAGQATGAWMEQNLAARRAAVHPVPAVLTENVPATDGGQQAWAKARWTDSDGVTHTGLARVGTGSRPGTPVTVWTDRSGRLVAEPPTAAEARLQSDLVGVAVGLTVGATAVGCGWLVRTRLDRRRWREWEVAWEKVEPRWRKKMIG